MHKLIKHQRSFSVTEGGLGWVETQGSTRYLQDTVLNKCENSEARKGFVAACGFSKYGNSTLKTHSCAGKSTVRKSKHHTLVASAFPCAL